MDWEDLIFQWAALVSPWEGFRFHRGAYLQKRNLASSRIAKASRVVDGDGAAGPGVPP